MADIIQVRRDTAANWTSADPTLAQGEAGWETDTSKIKYGDGATAWTALPYFTASLDVFVSRGDPAAFDLTEVDLAGGGATDTVDVFYEYDLNSIVGVPTSAKAVLLNIFIRDGTLGAGVRARDSANNNGIATSQIYVMVVNAVWVSDFVVPITNGIIDIASVLVKFSDFTNIKIIVKGWWL